MSLNKLPQRKGQGALEYLLLCGIVGFVAILSFAPNGLLSKVASTSKSYYNKITSVIQGKDPKPINGGWCDWVFYPNKGERYRSCECPAPAFGGQPCAGNHKEGACGATGTCFTFTPEYAACPDECGTKEVKLSPISCTRSDGAIGFPPNNCHGTKTCAATAACFTYTPVYAPCPETCGSLATTLDPISCMRSDGKPDFPTTFCSGTKYCDAPQACFTYTPEYAVPCPSACGSTVSTQSPISCKRSDGQSGFTPDHCPIIRLCPAKDPCPTYIPVFANCKPCGSPAETLLPIGCRSSEGITEPPSNKCSGSKYCGPTEGCFTYTPVYEACPGSCGTAAVYLPPISCIRSDGVTGISPVYCSTGQKFCPKTKDCPTYTPVYGAVCPTICGIDASSIPPIGCVRNDGWTGFPPNYCPVIKECAWTGYCPWGPATCNTSCGYGRMQGAVCQGAKCNPFTNPNLNNCKATWGCTGRWQVSGCSASCGWGTTSVACVGGPCDPDTQPASGACKDIRACTGYWKDLGCSKACGGGVTLSACINGPCDPDTQPKAVSCNSQACVITYTPVYPACTAKCGEASYKIYPTSCKGSDGMSYPKDKCNLEKTCPAGPRCK